MAASLLTSPAVAGAQVRLTQIAPRIKNVNPLGLGSAFRVRAEEKEVEKVVEEAATEAVTEAATEAPTEEPAEAPVEEAPAEVAVEEPPAPKAPAPVPAGERGLFFADDNSLTYLDGTLPGDYGFDPFGLLAPGSGDVGFVNPSWLRYAEIIHGRFAMLGAAGCITPEILSSWGVIPESTGIVWYRNGVIPPAGSADVYWVDPYTLFFVEVVAMQFAELRRLQDYRNPGSMGRHYFLGMESVLGGSGDPAYPGGAFFNMLNLGKTEEKLRELKTKELNNGRLAMMAMFGFGAQAIMTGKGPYENLLDHLADPFANNILTNWSTVYGQF